MITMNTSHSWKVTSFCVTLFTVALSGIIFVPCASAAPVLIQYTGTVDSVDAALTSLISNGDTVSVTYIYDPSLDTSNPGGPSPQEYTIVTDLQGSIQTSAGPISFIQQTAAPSENVYVVTNDNASQLPVIIDHAGAFIGLNGPALSNGFSPFVSLWALRELCFGCSPGPSMLMDNGIPDSHPTTVLGNAPFSEGVFTVDFRDTSFNSALVFGTLDTLTISAVPVPSAVWLFGSGLLGLIGISRRKKVKVD